MATKAISQSCTRAVPPDLGLSRCVTSDMRSGPPVEGWPEDHSAQPVFLKMSEMAPLPAQRKIWDKALNLISFLVLINPVGDKVVLSRIPCTPSHF